MVIKYLQPIKVGDYDSLKGLLPKGDILPISNNVYFQNKDESFSQCREREAIKPMSINMTGPALLRHLTDNGFERNLTGSFQSPMSGATSDWTLQLMCRLQAEYGINFEQLFFYNCSDTEEIIKGYESYFDTFGGTLTRPNHRDLMERFSEREFKQNELKRIIDIYMKRASVLPTTDSPLTQPGRPPCFPNCPSSSPSSSPSRTKSVSPSKSVAASASPSQSSAISQSPSPSAKPSQSPSNSPGGLTAVVSPSNSPAASLSPSSSILASVSPSSSISPSMSIEPPLPPPKRAYNGTNGENCNFACGNVVSTTDFVSKIGQILELNSITNTTNQQLLMFSPSYITIELIDFNISYPLIERLEYGTDIQIHHNCVCKCPVGTAKCSSTSNRCSESVVCANTYIGDAGRTNCYVPIENARGSVCCGIYANYADFEIHPSWLIGDPSLMFVAFNITMLLPYNSTDWALHNFKVTADLSGNELQYINSTIIAQDFNCTNPLFAFGLQMLQTSNLFTYQGGDRIIGGRDEDDNDYWLTATGWSDKYNSDASIPGWLKNKKSLQYNSNSMIQNTKISLLDCLDDEFRFNSTISKSSTATLPSISDYLNKYGDVHIDTVNAALVLKPRDFSSGMFRVLTNVMQNIAYHTGSLDSFDCVREDKKNIILNCNLTNFVGNSICFMLYDSTHQTALAASCGSPDVRSRSGSHTLKLSFNIGYGNEKTGFLCAQGFSKLNCKSVNITQDTYLEFDPNWVGENDTSFENHSDFGIDFGDWDITIPDSWFYDLANGFYTVLMFIAFAFAALLLLALCIFMTIMFLRLIMCLKRKKSFKKLNMQGIDTQNGGRKSNQSDSGLENLKNKYKKKKKKKTKNFFSYNKDSDSEEELVTFGHSGSQ